MMKVRNVEPCLICVGGQFIAPDQVVEVDDKAAGLDHFLSRGVLVAEEPEEPKKEGKQKE